MKPTPAEKPAVAPVPAGPDTEPPRLDTTKLVRLTEAADLSLWGLITNHTLSDLLAPGYFAGTWAFLESFDRIIVTTSADSTGPVHATLVITEVDCNKVTVAVLDRSDRT